MQESVHLFTGAPPTSNDDDDHGARDRLRNDLVMRTVNHRALETVEPEALCREVDHSHEGSSRCRTTLPIHKRRIVDVCDAVGSGNDDPFDVTAVAQGLHGLFNKCAVYQLAARAIPDIDRNHSDSRWITSRTPALAKPSSSSTTLRT